MIAVVAQQWEERERGWGSNTDGFSVHLTQIDRENFIKDHWARYPDSPVPYYYRAPCGNPVLTVIDEEAAEKLRETENGMYMADDWKPGDGFIG